MACETAFSFYMSTVGLVLTFILTDHPLSAGLPASPISNAVSITTAVWISERGQRRPLTLSQAASATFTYVVVADDSRTPHVEQGYVEVTMGDSVFPTKHFAITVAPHF